MTFAHNFRYTAKPNADTSIDTQYQDGSKPVAGPLVGVDAVAYAALIGSLQNLPQGVPVSYNVRSVLTGPERLTAAITLTTVSGSDAAANGWTAPGSGSNLTGSASTAVAGVFDLVATDSRGNPAVYPPTVWSVVATSGSDVMAPNVPTGVIATAGTGVIQLTFDAASENYDGTITPSGVHHYDIFDGATKLTPPSPLVSASSEKNPKLALTHIGNASPTGTAVQNKQAWTVTGAGIGFHNNTAEECEFLGAQFSGDNAMAVAIDAFTSPNQFSTAGIMVRESNAPGAVFVAFYIQPSVPGNGLQLKARMTAGGVGLNQKSLASITGNIRLRADRVGNVFTFYYSADGGKWNVFATLTVGMAAICQWGVVVASQTAGVACSATFRDINFAVNPQIVVSIASTVARILSVSAVDVAGNASTKSLAVSASPLSTGLGAIKLPSGYHIYFDSNHAATNLSRLPTYHAALKNDPNVRGYHIYLTWAEIEGAVQGDFSKLDAVINQVRTIIAGSNKTWSMGLWTASFGAAPASGSGVAIPAYAVQAGYYQNAPAGTTVAGGLGSVVDYTNPGAQAALQGVNAAVAARLDNDDKFVCWIPIGETSVASAMPGFGTVGQNAFYNYIYNVLLPQCGAVFKKTICRLQTNYLNVPTNNVPSSAQMFSNIFDRMQALGNWVPGGPDPTNAGNGPAAPTTAEKVFRGAVSPFPDRRGQWPWWGEIEEGGQGNPNVWSNPSVIGNSPTNAQVVADIVAYERDQQGAYMFLVNAQTYLAIQWPDWKTFIDAHPLLRTGVPALGIWTPA